MTLFEAMRQAKDFSVRNVLTVKLLLLLAVRKGDRRVLLGGFVNVGEYMRQLIRSDAKAQQHGRLRDRLADLLSGVESVPASDSR